MIIATFKLNQFEASVIKTQRDGYEVTTYQNNVRQSKSNYVYLQNALEEYTEIVLDKNE